MARFSRVMDRVDLQGGQRNNAYIYRDPQKGGKWHLYFLNRETNKNHRFVLKRCTGGHLLGKHLHAPRTLQFIGLRSGVLVSGGTACVPDGTGHQSEPLAFANMGTVHSF
jgi:hypothetical protein